MKKYKVLITAPYMQIDSERSYVERALGDFDFEVSFAMPLERFSSEELLDLIQGVDGVICGDDEFTEEVIKSSKKLRAIIKWGTGIDSIDVTTANELGIYVGRTADAFTNPVADTVVGYMLASCRNIFENNERVKNGDWTKPQGHTLGEKKVGIIGFGNIGRAVAKRLRPFACEILVNDIVEIKPEEEGHFGVRKVSLDELLETAEFITLHPDLNPTSRHLLSKEAFLKMRNRPYIINTSRGGTINQQDLIEALKLGLISGAALDVFESEPLKMESELRGFSQVMLSAHNSNSSPKCWRNVHLNSLRLLKEALVK